MNNKQRLERGLPIIKCERCVNKGRGVISPLGDVGLICNSHYRPVDPDDFCSEGETTSDAYASRKLAKCLAEQKEGVEVMYHYRCGYMPKMTMSSPNLLAGYYLARARMCTQCERRDYCENTLNIIKEEVPNE